MNEERLLKVLVGPHISEKATILAEKQKQVVFRVASFATKLDVKKAVENLFKVKVNHVKIINVKGKTRRFKQVLGKKNDWKKAYVALQPGYDIDFMSVATGTKG